MTDERVLLTGATGFVGRSLYPHLRDAGWDVRCASRSPDRARAQAPDREWVRLDLDEPSTLEPALEGCTRAVYLVHSMASGPDYAAREREAALAFARAASSAELKRVVYLGGVEPAGIPSRHLRSRLETGSVLRESFPRTVELRAGMIIGSGSQSWKICRDLASRLPFMILPRWLSSRSQPVAISDVAAALTHAVGNDDLRGGAFDLPGPETLTAKEILLRIARLRGTEPKTLSVPLVSPRLSSFWIHLVTDADISIARELVEGLTVDLVSHGPVYWEHMPGLVPTSFDIAARRALAEDEPRSTPTRLLERMVQSVARKATPRA